METENETRLLARMVLHIIKPYAKKLGTITKFFNNFIKIDLKNFSIYEYPLFHYTVFYKCNFSNIQMFNVNFFNVIIYNPVSFGNGFVNTYMKCQSFNSKIYLHQEDKFEQFRLDYTIDFNGTKRIKNKDPKDPIKYKFRYGDKLIINILRE